MNNNPIKLDSDFIYVNCPYCQDIKSFTVDDVKTYYAFATGWRIQKNYYVECPQCHKKLSITSNFKRTI